MVAALSYWQCTFPYRIFANVLVPISQFLFLELKLLVFCSGKFHLVPIYLNLLPTLSSFRFHVTGFIWRSFIHLGFIFIQGDKKRYICILVHANGQLNQHHLLKMGSYIHRVALGIYTKVKWPYVCGFMYWSSFMLPWSICLSLYQLHLIFHHYYSLL